MFSTIYALLSSKITSIGLLGEAHQCIVDNLKLEMLLLKDGPCKSAVTHVKEIETPNMDITSHDKPIIVEGLAQTESRPIV